MAAPAAAHGSASAPDSSSSTSFAAAMASGPIGVLASSTLGYWAYAGGQSTTFGVMKSATRDGVGLSELEISSSNYTCRPTHRSFSSGV